VCVKGVWISEKIKKYVYSVFGSGGVHCSGDLGGIHVWGFRSELIVVETCMSALQLMCFHVARGY
jgi:hypothetical protein